MIQLIDCTNSTLLLTLFHHPSQWQADDQGDLWSQPDTHWLRSTQRQAEDVPQSRITFLLLQQESLQEIDGSECVPKECQQPQDPRPQD